MNTNVLKVLLPALLIAGCGQGGHDNSGAANDGLQPATCDEPFPVPAGCEEAACKMARCGEADSFLDEYRCERKHCETQEDCGPGEECRLAVYLYPSCDYNDDGTCFCGSNLMTVESLLCLPNQ